MSSWIFLAAALLGAGLTASSWARLRHLHVLTVPYFLGAWLTGELALQHIAWQALATLVFAAFGALDAWPGRVGLGLSFASWGALGWAHVRAASRGSKLRRSLAEQGLEGAEREEGLAPAYSFHPFHWRRKEVQRIRDLEYGPSLPGDRGRRNRLDILRPAQPGRDRPVLLQVHGGAWVTGEKEQQGQPLLYHLAARGWLCCAINYRLAPGALFPDPVVDVKRALAWIRGHVAEFGGDPDFVCITGGSAGGHLAALAALTPEDPLFQPGFEEVDTRVAACVPFYGVYDLLDRQGIRGPSSMRPFLQRMVLRCSPQEDPELWEACSPIARIHADAPPFLVIQGTHDSLVFVEEARAFVAALRQKSCSRVLYLEIERAQHAFDIFRSVHSDQAVAAVTAFLEEVSAGRRSQGSAPAIQDGGIQAQPEEPDSGSEAFWKTESWSR